MASRYRLKTTLWLIAGLAGALAFWLVQVLAGGPTIPAFVGGQVAAAGGYPAALAPAIGWAVHVGVSLAYALVFGLIVLVLAPLSYRTGAALAMVVALALAWITTAIAPPAISVTIGLLAGQGWPDELFPLNTERGLPFWNHVGFFLVNWVIQALGPGVIRAASDASAP
jgi:hypothetical protein